MAKKKKYRKRGANNIVGMRRAKAEAKLIVMFGKHAGLRLSQVRVRDKQYWDWLHASGVVKRIYEDNKKDKDGNLIKQWPPKNHGTATGV
ncbi:MAG: hypothetical protein CMK32_10145 [Porticoccaceae bacterium]|nr:hypothetical protein [Porticoccaceae bacterium]